MSVKARKKRKKKSTPPRLLRVSFLKEEGCLVTSIRIDEHIDVRAEDRSLCFWCEGREVRGPLSKEQCEKLSEDLGYDAVD